MKRSEFNQSYLRIIKNNNPNDYLCVLKEINDFLLDY
jgi:hypothetical protein